MKMNNHDDSKVFKKIIKDLIKEGWDASEESDNDFGQIVLAYKDIPGFGPMLKRIKPYFTSNEENRQSAKRLQEKLRRQLVEVVTYETYRNENNQLSFKILKDLY